MSTYKELAKQAEQINDQLYTFSKDAFEKALAAGVVLDEQRDDDGEYVFLPTKAKYKFDGFEIDSKGIEIKGSIYAGCGDYDYTHIHIPFDMLDNLDAWIEQQKAEIDEASRKRVEAKEAKEAQEKLEQEQAEREHFQALKEKYEGQGTNQVVAGN
jgi:hypothetical protein